MCWYGRCPWRRRLERLLRVPRGKAGVTAAPGCPSATSFRRIRDFSLNYKYSKMPRKLGNEITKSLLVTLGTVFCIWNEGRFLDNNTYILFPRRVNYD